MARIVRWESPPDEAALLRAVTEQYSGHEPFIRIERYTITGYTPCGVWINAYNPKPKFVNLKSTKQWASSTEEEAVKQLKYRKAAHVRILRAQLASAEWALTMLQEEIEVEPTPKRLTYEFPLRLEFK